MGALKADCRITSPERTEVLTPFGRVIISKRPGEHEHLVEIVLRPGYLMFGRENEVFEGRLVGRVIRYKND